jgi:hypothetical protein
VGGGERKKKVAAAGQWGGAYEGGGGRASTWLRSERRDLNTPTSPCVDNVRMARTR